MKGLSIVANTELKVVTVFFLIGLALYVATYYAYDRLLMPIRYWGGRAHK
jgi:hypothetical protein